MSTGRSYYASAHWKKLSGAVKLRDAEQCQVCGDVKGDPYCQLHAHHINPRSQAGPDKPENITTLCDLCHAVVTCRWHRPWFGELTDQQKQELELARQEYLEFLALDPATRAARQVLLWTQFAVKKQFSV